MGKKKEKGHNENQIYDKIRNKVVVDDGGEDEDEDEDDTVVVQLVAVAVAVADHLLS